MTHPNRTRRRGDNVGLICYAPHAREWQYWNGAVQRDQSDDLGELRGRWPLADVHVQAELLDAELRVRPELAPELPSMACRYFAACDRPAVGAVNAGPAGVVPCCQRCADRVGATLVPIVATGGE